MTEKQRVMTVLIVEREHAEQEVAMLEQEVESLRATEQLLFQRASVLANLRRAIARYESQP
jgi:hypothetical protein